MALVRIHHNIPSAALFFPIKFPGHGIYDVSAKICRRSTEQQPSILLMHSAPPDIALHPLPPPQLNMDVFIICSSTADSAGEVNNYCSLLTNFHCFQKLL
jgi:hypothetical protein